MSKQIHIFATKADLIPVLKLTESQRKIKYVRYDIYKSPDIPIYESLLNYKNIGINTTGDHNSGEIFLIMDKDNTVKFEKTNNILGVTKYSVNQTVNPDSVTFQPGGLFKNRFLICGHIGTSSDSVISSELLKQFSKIIKKGFKRVRSYYVGENAIELLKSGLRLITMGIDEPTEYDLQL